MVAFTAGTVQQYCMYYYDVLCWSVSYIPNTPFGAPGGPKKIKPNIILKNFSITSLHSIKKIN